MKLLINKLTFLIVFSLNFYGFSQCPSGALAVTGAGCGCLSGCDLTSFGGPNCSPSVGGNCGGASGAGGQKNMQVDIVVPDGCTYTVNAQMQTRSGCTASGADAGETMKVDILGGGKGFKTGGSNATITDSYILIGPGTIRVSGSANRADEIITYQTTSSGATCINCLSTLPIELVEFSAEPEKEAVELKWTTVSEFNNDYFTIERSQNGIDFTPYYRIKGNGTTNERFDYSIMDYSPFWGLSYYRLRQTDFDGASTTSKIIPVFFEDGDFYKLSPNPANDLVYIEGKEIEKSEITFFNALGKEIVIQSIKEANKVAYDISLLSSGTYTVKVVYHGSIQYKKLNKL